MSSSFEAFQSAVSESSVSESAVSESSVSESAVSGLSHCAPLQSGSLTDDVVNGARRKPCKNSSREHDHRGHTDSDYSAVSVAHADTQECAKEAVFANAPFVEPPFVDLRRYHEPGYDAGGSRLAMLVWWLVQSVCFPLSPHFAHGFRRWLLRRFGATIGEGVRIRPTARFTYPWNVEIGDYSWVGDDVVFYSLAPIKVGCHCVVSQKSYLCTGSHDISDSRFALITGEIVIENGAWIAADCFVASGVRIGANTVIAARSSVMRSMPAAQVCQGTPCRPVKARPMSTQPRVSNQSA